MQAGCNGIRPALFWGEREKRRCGGKFPVYIPEDRRYHKRRDGLGRMPGDGGMRVRLFIGILLPRAVRDSVAESARLLEQHCAAGRFVPRENYHLTLAFLGEQPEGALETIWKGLDGCRCAPFPVTVGGFGAFEQRGGGVLWRGVEAPPALEALQGELKRRLAGVGIGLEDRPFRPHLTLARRARLMAGVSLEALSAGVERPAFSVDGLALMRSHLSEAGARYTCLGQVEFKVI